MLKLEFQGETYEFDDIDQLETTIKRLGEDVAEAIARAEYYKNQVDALTPQLKALIELKNKTRHPIAGE